MSPTNHHSGQHVQVSYEGKTGGYHCHLCDEPTSAYGHYVEARYSGGVRRRLIGGGAYSCQPGFADIPLEPKSSA